MVVVNHVNPQSDERRHRVQNRSLGPFSARSSMPKKRQLLREEITYSKAKEWEVNVLHRLGYYGQMINFFTHLYGQREWMKTVVAHHLGLRSSGACLVAEVEEWLCGSFNVCIPVTIENWKNRQQAGQRVILRFPLPYRVGEDFCPGNGDEKIRCEAGTYAWLQENCPDVPIPRLYGFAMSTGETFTRLENLPFLPRCYQLLRRRLLSWLGYPIPSNYVRHQLKQRTPQDGVTGAGYMLIECIEETHGTMLSKTWLDKHQESRLRANFFRDLSRILLSISRIPLPRIGSFMIDNNGYLFLTNRPLTLELQDLENQKIPTDVPRDCTYSTVDSYVVDLLGTHDNRLRHQPNAVNDVTDCACQMAAHAAMRTIFPLFFQRELRRGPFVMTLTDLHPSNILVDDDWHITCLVDLEWACSRPIEMVQLPHWLANKAVDEIVPEEFDVVRSEFMAILTAEETQRCGYSESTKLSMPRLSNVMNSAWETGTFWYTLALFSPTGLFNLFYDRIRPKFDEGDPSEFPKVMPFFWDKDAAGFVARKLSDKKKYDNELELAFR